VQHFRIYLWPLVLWLIGLALSYHAAVLEYERAHLSHRNAIRSDLEPLRAALGRELFGAVYLTEGLGALVAVEGGLVPDKLSQLAAELFRRSDLLRNVAIAPDNVVAFVYPVKGNEQALGLDYASRSDQWPSVARMMKEQRLVVAGPVALVQGGIGVIGRAPIYLVDEHGNREYFGLTSTVIELERLLERTGWTSAARRLDVAFRGVDGLGAVGEVFWGPSEVWQRDPITLSLAVPGGTWQIAAIPKRGWAQFSWHRSLAFLGGAAASLLLSALVLGLLRAAELREREIERRQQVEVELRGARDFLEHRVRERTHELEVARDAAESADRLKSAFLATMSHELRTPLNSIIGFSGVLLQNLAGPLNDEQRKQLMMVRGSADHLLALINDVLDLSRIEAGQMRLQYETFDVNASVQKVAATLGPQLARKGLDFELRVEPGVAELHSDRRRFEQILMNLLANAVKFTERGRIEARARSHEGRLWVEVSDTGIGIAESDLDRLFKPFSQVDIGLDRRHEGTGLGLLICKRLVEMLGGGIGVRSLEGQGSTFSFWLPSVASPIAKETHEQV